MSAKSNADLTQSASSKRATDSKVLGSAKSVASAFGEKNSIADDLESLHVPVGEEEDHMRKRKKRRLFLKCPIPM